jgi:hypothetical protein
VPRVGQGVGLGGVLGGGAGGVLGGGDDVGLGVGDGEGFVLTKIATCDPVFWKVPPVGD